MYYSILGRPRRSEKIPDAAEVYLGQSEPISSHEEIVKVSRFAGPYIFPLEILLHRNLTSTLDPHDSPPRAHPPFVSTPASL